MIVHGGDAVQLKTAAETPCSLCIDTVTGQLRVVDQGTKSGWGGVGRGGGGGGGEAGV